MSFGKRIRQLRNIQQLTQQELAEQLQEEGLQASFTYISKIENNRIAPSIEFIHGLARVLDTDVEELLDLAGKVDHKALQAVVVDMPEAGVLLRRLQSGKISQQQVKRFLAQVGA